MLDAFCPREGLISITSTPGSLPPFQSSAFAPGFPNYFGWQPTLGHFGCTLHNELEIYESNTYQRNQP